MWKVLIKKFENNEIIKEIECKSERQAVKVEGGVMINMNNEDYYTEVVNA